MLDHIVTLLRENNATLRDVVSLVIDLLRAWGVDAKLAEHYGGSDGTHLVIHLRKVREI
jgi:hypothetical protein